PAETEFARAQGLSYGPLKLFPSRLAVYADEMFPGGQRWFKSFLTALGRDEKLRVEFPDELNDKRKSFDPAPRQKRQFDQLVDFTQNLLPEAAKRRHEFLWSKLDTSSLGKLQKSQAAPRQYFAKEIIGELPQPDMPLNPRTRLIYETDKWKGYEVVLD